MSNPYLPAWEYIPDGEPRVFGDRVYIYGSHDHAASDCFCDYKLKVWSAHVSNLNDWVCHGDIFHTTADRDHKADIDRPQKYLYAPDVVEKDGKYYLYAYIAETKGCVAVADRPEGPFVFLSEYKYTPNAEDKDYCDKGLFIDPGVLIDDDGKVYLYCGYLRSWMAQLNPDNMYEVIDGTHSYDIIPKTGEHDFFEACSPRKIGDTYYMIYSQNPPNCGRLVYATSDSPTGPFKYRGVIIDNGADYPGGNNHGSVCEINGKWYIFYHRMTNGTIMSRRACADRIEFLPDGSIKQTEMTCLGFEESLSPYALTPAEIACVLKGGCIVTELNVFERTVTNITDGCVIGYKYFDFGEDYSSATMELAIKTRGTGCVSRLRVYIDSTDDSANEIGVCYVGVGDGVYNCIVKSVTGRHAVYFKAESAAKGGFVKMFDGRNLFMFDSFVFMK